MEEDRTPNKTLLKMVLAGITLAALTGFLPNDLHDATVSAAIADEVTARACVAQYGPSERWIREKKPACALGTNDVPAHILSYPLATK